MNIGIIGCGNISETYFECQKIFNNFKIVACADINKEVASSAASKYNVNALSVDEILENNEIDLIINLTIPAAHKEIITKSLLNGKHCFSEKPLAMNFREGLEIQKLANEKGLYVGCAPDTFLGAGIQEAKKIIDQNEIGKINLGSISMGVAGHEIWHPNPDFYYKYGGGPILDMGPYYFTALVNLLGPAKNVFTQSRKVYQKRVIGSGDRQGQEIEVEIPTTLVSQIEFQNGALIDSFFSFDVWKHSKNHIELYGDKGSINIPDPNMFGGDILVCKSKNGNWENIDTKHNNLGKINIKNKSEKANESAGIANYRGIGVSETVDAIKNNRLNRCSGELSLHVLDILDSIIKSSKENKKIELRSSIKNLNYFSENEISNLLK